jgi:lysophospholipase L1-like esterase
METTTGPTARERLAPQMADYDFWGSQMAWRPFIMFFQPPDLRTASCNTDSLGFRFSADPSGNVARSDEWQDRPCNLVFGNSVAFSVGATSDAASLSARMSHYSGETWLNFSGRAFAASQEYLTFLFYRHRVGPHKQVVLFSGSNDLYLYYAPKMFDETFGIFFFSDVFAERMNPKPPPEVPHWSKQMLASVFRRIKPARGKPVNTKQLPNLDEVIAERRQTREKAMTLLARSLENWKLAADGLGIDLLYALQPVRSWVKKPFSPEELELEAEIDEHGSKWNKILAKVMDEEQYHWYKGRVAEECRRLLIPFLDLNEILSNHPRNHEWIFMDYLHLTDAGYDICAEVLARYFQDLKTERNPEVASAPVGRV